SGQLVRGRKPGQAQQPLVWNKPSPWFTSDSSMGSSAARGPLSYFDSVVVPELPLLEAGALPEPLLQPARARTRTKTARNLMTRTPFYGHWVREAEDDRQDAGESLPGARARPCGRSGLPPCARGSGRGRPSLWS